MPEVAIFWALDGPRARVIRPAGSTAAVAAVANVAVAAPAASTESVAASYESDGNPTRFEITFKNESTSALIAVRPAANGGGAAALHTAGSWTILPGGFVTFEGTLAAGAFNVIASVADAPLTVFSR
jgi:hypothetical protein